MAVNHSNSIVQSRGVDWRERIDSMAEVQEYAKKKGVDLCFSIRKGADNENQTDGDERY